MQFYHRSFRAWAATNIHSFTLRSHMRSKLNPETNRDCLQSSCKYELQHIVQSRNVSANYHSLWGSLVNHQPLRQPLTKFHSVSAVTWNSLTRFIKQCLRTVETVRKLKNLHWVQIMWYLALTNLILRQSVYIEWIGLAPTTPILFNTRNKWALL